MWCLTSKKPWIILNKNIREEKMFRTITSHILYNGFLKCCTMDFKNFWNLKHVGKLNNTNVRVNQKYHFSSKSLWNRNQFSSVAQSCPTLCDPMNHSMSGLPVHHQLREFKLRSIELVMRSSHLILCGPLHLLPLIPSSIRVYPNESTLHIRWPKYWSFIFSISPSNEQDWSPLGWTGWISLQSLTKLKIKLLYDPAKPTPGDISGGNSLEKIYAP